MSTLRNTTPVFSRTRREVEVPNASSDGATFLQSFRREHRWHGEVARIPFPKFPPFFGSLRRTKKGGGGEGESESKRAQILSAGIEEFKSGAPTFPYTESRINLPLCSGAALQFPPRHCHECKKGGEGESNL